MAVCVMTCVLIAAASGASTPAAWAHSLCTGKMTFQSPLPTPEAWVYLPYVSKMMFQSPLPTPEVRVYLPYISKKIRQPSLFIPKAWMCPGRINKRGPGCCWRRR